MLLAIYVYMYIFLIVRNSNGIQAEANECVSINVWIWFACYFLENSFVPPLDILCGLPLNLCLATNCTEFLLYTVNRVTCPLFWISCMAILYLLQLGHFESGIRQVLRSAKRAPVNVRRLNNRKWRQRYCLVGERLQALALLNAALLWRGLCGPIWGSNTFMDTMWVVRNTRVLSL